MNTIKSPLAGTRAVLRLNEEAAPEGCVSVMIDLRDGRAFAVPVPTADLLAALDATANTDVAGMRRDLQDELRAARVHYEGELSATRANRDENARLLREALMLRDEWKARAEKAEATVAAVRAWRDGEEQFDALDAILNPRPAFTLPTEVPARIEAKRDGKTYTFYLWTNGSGTSNDLIWVDEDDWTHSLSPARLLERFTDHRLIGAES